MQTRRRNSSQSPKNVRQSLPGFRKQTSLCRRAVTAAAFAVVATLGLGIIVVGGRAATSNFHWLPARVELFVAQNTQQAGPASVNAVCTWNGSVDNNWATPANWTGCTGGGVPAAADSVLLDNSLKAGTYSVSLPPGAVNTTIVKLTITPGVGNNITLSLPSGNTNNPGFTVGDATTATDDLILNNGGVFQNSSGAGAGNGIAFASAANDTLRINNGGRYLHNTLRGNAGIVSQLSTAIGTENGTFEFDVPGTGAFSPSASGRNFGNLTLTRTAGAASYTVSGGSALTIRGNLLINPGVTFSSTMTGALNLAGNLTNNGTALAIPATQAISFGNTTVTGTGSVSIASASSTVPGSCTLALGAVTFSNSGTLTITGTLQINQGGFPGGPGTYSYHPTLAGLFFNNTSGSYVVNNDNYWPAVNGPQNIVLQGAGGITLNVPRTVSGSFRYSAGVLNAGNLTTTNFTQVNAGGFMSGSPTYGPSAILVYNTGGSYGRNGEWLPGATSGAGYPTNVQITNSTNLDLPNGSSSSPFQMGGVLSIDPGSKLELSPMTQPLTVVGGVSIVGTLNLSTSPGGGMNVGDYWSNFGTFNPSANGVNFNGPTGQTLSGNTSFYNLTKSTAGAQTLIFAEASTTTVTNSLTLNGAPGNLLSLRSATPTVRWKLIAPATQSVSFVDVQDSDATGPNPVIASNSVNSGNNLNWVFGVPDYTVTTTGNAIVVNDVSGNGDFLNMSEPGAGQIKFAAAGRFFSVDGGPVINGDSGNLSLSGINSVTVNQNAGSDVFDVGAFTSSFPNFIVNGGIGDDFVRFNGNLTFAANANLDLDLQNDDASPGLDRVSFSLNSNVALFGTGAVTTRVSESISFGQSTLQVVNGNITLEANQQAIPSPSNSQGIAVSGSAVITTSGAGNIILKGRGGEDATNSSHLGILLQTGSLIQSTSTLAGAGTITLDGRAGLSSIGARGVQIGSTNTTIQSARGDISITGHGAVSAGGSNWGVVVQAGALVNSTGAAKITIDGTGADGAIIAFGVRLTGANSKVTSSGGDIQITGQAGNGGGTANIGVFVDSGGKVTATGAANVAISGTGGNGTDFNIGVNLDGRNNAGTAVSSVNGNISITGVATDTTGVGQDGVRFEDSVGAQAVAVTTTGIGSLTITGTAGNNDPTSAGIDFVDDTTMSLSGATNAFIADTMDIGNSAVLLSAGANALTLRPRTNGHAIDLGGADSATQLGLTDAELDQITAGTLNFGNASSGAITVSAPIGPPATMNLNLVSGANIDIAGGSLNSAGGNVTLVPGTNVFPSLSGVDVSSGAGTVALTSVKDLKIVINNTTVDSGYTQLNVAGLVNLNNATIAFSGTHTPVLGQQFIIVNNDGADSISGIFNSLSQGTVIPHFLGSGLGAQISYTGGDGNDAVLTVVNQPTAANGVVSGQILDSNGLPVEGAAVRLSGTQNRLTVTDAFGNYRFDEVETTGFYNVTPSRANFVFGPTERSFNQLGNNTAAVFTAWATGEARNPLDTTEYFVRQQYVDFLGREPDEAGLNFWVNNIQSCGNDAHCRAVKRTDTSAAFFLSTEFRQTGYLVYRVYQSAYGDLPGALVPLRLSEFRPDTVRIGDGVVVNQTGWAARLEANTLACLEDFVQRPRFVAAYPATLAPDEFVDRLFRNAGVIPAGADRQAAVAEFASAQNSADVGARGRALRRVAEHPALEQREFNRAFVLMQYFGYLRRDANTAPDTDFSGYYFWLDKLNTFNGNFRQAEMVKAFLVSSEYRGRFPR